MAPERQQDGRQRILSEAESLFTEKGYQAVSIREIAQAADVTNAALYYHFSNKEGLYHEVMLQHANALANAMREAGEGKDDLVEQLTGMLSIFAERSYGRRSPLSGLRRSRGHGADPDVHRQFMRTIFEPIVSVLAEAQMTGEFEPLPGSLEASSMLLGMVHGQLAHRRMTEQSVLTPKEIKSIVEIFWCGLTARKKESDL